MASNISSVSSNAALSSLLRAQSTGVTTLKSNTQATQTIINQLQQSAGSGRSVPSTQVASANSSLPRGSLVDISV